MDTAILFLMHIFSPVFRLFSWLDAVGVPIMGGVGVAVVFGAVLYIVLENNPE